MPSKKHIEIIISANDKASKDLNKLKQSFVNIMAPVRALMLGISASMAVVSTAIFAATKSTAKMGDAFLKMSGRTGIAVKTLSQMAHAVKLSGSDMTTFERAMRNLSDKMSDVQQGIGTITKTFNDLGLEVEGTKGTLKSADKMFMDIVTVINSVKDETKQTAIAMELLGQKAGPELLNLIKSGTAGITDMMTEAEKLRITFTKLEAEEAAKFNDSMDKLTGTFTGLKNEIGKSFIPVITELSESFVTAVTESGLFQTDLKELQKNMLNFAKDISKAIKPLIHTSQAFYYNWKSMSDLFKGDFKSAAENQLKVLKHLWESLGKGTPEAEALGNKIIGINEAMKDGVPILSAFEIAWQKNNVATNKTIKSLDDVSTSATTVKKKLEEMPTNFMPYVAIDMTERKLVGVDYQLEQIEIKLKNGTYEKIPLAFTKSEPAAKKLVEHVKEMQSLGKMFGDAMKSAFDIKATFIGIVMSALKDIRNAAIEPIEEYVSKFVKPLATEMARLSESTLKQFEFMMPLAEAVAEMMKPINDVLLDLTEMLINLSGLKLVIMLLVEATKFMGDLLKSLYVNLSPLILELKKITAASMTVTDNLRDIIKELKRLSVSTTPGQTKDTGIGGGTGTGGGTGFKFPVFDFPKFAAGGIVEKPTLALIGDNPGGREAVIPMRGGKIPVDFGGMGKQNITYNTTINVTEADLLDKPDHYFERLIMSKILPILNEIGDRGATIRLPYSQSNI